MDTEYILRNLLFFIIVFIIVFVFCYFIAGRIKPSKEYNKEKKKKKKWTYKMMPESKFLILHYNLDEKKIDLGKLNLGVSLCNAFIISAASTIINMIPLKMMWQLLIGFVIVFVLIYAVFEIYGRILNKKWGKDNE